MFSKPLSLLAITAPKVKPPAKPRANMQVLSNFWPKKIMRRPTTPAKTATIWAPKGVKGARMLTMSVELVIVCPTAGTMRVQYGYSMAMVESGHFYDLDYDLDDPATFRRKSLQFLRFSLNFLMIYYLKIEKKKCLAVPCRAKRLNPIWGGDG